MKRARNTKKSTHTNKKSNNKSASSPVIIFVLLFTIIAGIIGYFLWINNQSGKSALVPVDEKEGKINVLLLGVDHGG